MSYRIEYDSRVGKYEVREDASLFPWMVTVLGGLLMMLCIQAEELTPLKEIMIPGENTLTIQAFSTMTDDLRSGATISDAIEAFCKAVIHGS